MEVIHNAQKYIPSKYYKTLSNIELEDFISSKKKTSKFRFDIKWNSKIKTDMGEEITVNIFVDTKKYSMASNMFNNLDQFKAYINEIDNFDQFYIIQQGGRGVTKEQIVSQLEMAIAKDAKSVFYTKPELWEKIRIDNFEELERLCRKHEFSKGSKYQALKKMILTTK